MCGRIRFLFKTDALKLVRAYEMARSFQKKLRDSLSFVARLKFLERLLNRLVLQGAFKLA